MSDTVDRIARAIARVEGDTEDWRAFLPHAERIEAEVILPLRHLIWEMDETVADCCGCLGHVDEELRERINGAALQTGGE
jgi:hypothetical protein